MKLSIGLPEFPVVRVRWDRSRTIEQKCSSSNLPLELVMEADRCTFFWRFYTQYCRRLSAPVGDCRRLSAPVGELSAPVGELSAPVHVGELRRLSAPVGELSAPDTADSCGRLSINYCEKGRQGPGL